MKRIFTIICVIFISLILKASGSITAPVIAGIRIEFILFALTLIGVAIFHSKTMYVAITGLILVVIVKYLFTPGFSLIHHVFGDAQHEGEWRILLNLLGLLLGFAILARHFKDSKIPEILPSVLPDDWKGGFVLLLIIFVLSSFLDNIAAAIIGGTIAMVVFKGKVHLGYLAAIIAASNAGGSGSIIGDTTTTLMWIDGVKPMDVLHAYIAAGTALLFFGYFASKQQDRYQRIQPDSTSSHKPDWIKISIVILILFLIIATNYLFNFPALGLWIAILIGSFISKTPWGELKKSWHGAVFLVSLVACASLMPVEELPTASWQSAFSLGFVSAIFDNIPLTKLCLDQGRYDWGILAYSVGFGGSMIWFGSSAGVALSDMYPEITYTFTYLKKGWHIIVAYIIGFFILLGLLGWNPHAPHRESQQTDTVIK
jgi:Na+/H+ antiporter NhaD/arsenite permease-like protein